MNQMLEQQHLALSPESHEISLHQAQPIQNIEILLQSKAAEIMEDDGASESPKHVASDSQEPSPRASGL